MDENNVNHVNNNKIENKNIIKNIQSNKQVQNTLSCWLLVCSLCWNNLTNGWIWITYATIIDHANSFYHVAAFQMNWMSMVFSVVICILGLPSIWFINKFGIKNTLLSVALLNALCGLLRWLSSEKFIKIESNYALLLVSQIIGGIAQPLTIFSSTRLAAIWFRDDYTIIANTISAMGNPLGVILGSYISPKIVHNANEIVYLNRRFIAVPAFGLLLCVLAIVIAPKEHSKTLLVEDPDLLPSIYEQLISCLKNYNFMILNITFGIIVGTFTTISTLIQQILCPWGYDDEFSGLAGAILLISGFPGALVCGLFVYRSKRRFLFEINQVSIALCSLGFIGFTIVSTLPNLKMAILFSLSVMGFFGFGCYSAALELAAEISWPANEIISTGLLLFLSQLFSVITIVLMSEYGATKLSKIYGGSKCQTDVVKDFWGPITVLSVFCCFATAWVCLSLVKEFTKSRWKKILEREKIRNIENNGQYNSISLPYEIDRDHENNV